jgi:hypothetical protein
LPLTTRSNVQSTHHLAPRQCGGGEEYEQHEQRHGREGADEGARDALAEGVELLADGEPVGLGIALVRRYTIAAAADVTSASIAFVRIAKNSAVNAHSVAVCCAERRACLTLTASKKTKTSLLYFGLLLMMRTMERGIDTTK